MATQSDLVSFVTQVTRPDDFDRFWDGVLDDLAAIPLAATAVPDPLRSTDTVRVMAITTMPNSSDRWNGSTKFPTRCS